MANTIPGGALSDLLPRLDRNRNKLVDASEASIVGRVGNDNGYNGLTETAEALESGRAALKDFRLSAEDADAVASRLAGGDAWVSKEDVYISDAARGRIDGYGGAADGRVSKAELSGALQRGGFALHRDGIFLSNELDARLGASRPTPPTTDRPTPPPVGRPTPPPIGRPVPPSTDRPTPPSIGWAPREVSDRYTQQRRALSDLYNRSGGLMSYSEFQHRDRELAQGAVQDLVQGTRGAAYGDRRRALSDVYNGAGGNMSYSEFQAADRSLIRSALDDLMAMPADYRASRRQLSDIYNGAGGNMSYSEFQSADRDLIRYAVEDLLRMPGSYDQKKSRLYDIYNTAGGNMSYSEFQSADRRLLDQSLGRL